MNYTRGKLLLVILVISLGWVWSIPVAHADPHAMFYTVIGQQQLFFNVLAALDQADYVETPQQRQALAQQRAAAGYKPEDFQTLTPTTSNLSSVLTRGVTLEGQDLWSAYETQQLALEAARRNATGEFVALGCERGLGRVGCSRNFPEWQQNQAFVTDAVDWAQQYFTEGVVGMLMSGTKEDQDIRRKRLGLEPGDSSAQTQPLIPRAYSTLIATIRADIEKITNKQTKQQAKDEFTIILNNSASQFVAHNFRTDAYNNIEINADGVVKPKVTYKGSGSGVVSGNEYIKDYLDLVIQREDFVTAISEELASGADFIRQQQALTEQQGAVADLAYDPKVVTFKDDQGKETKAYGELRTDIKTPAYAKLALTNATANAIANLDQNQVYAPPEAVKTPGNVRLVGPKDLNGVAPAVLGAQTTSDTNQGQVLGLLDAASTYPQSFFDKPSKNTNGPDVNPISPNREEVITSALRAFTGDTYRKNDPSAIDVSCGYCTNLSAIIQNAFKQKP